MNEKQLQDFTIKKANERGILAYKTVSVGRRGFPDLTLIGEGGVVWFVELKHPNGKGQLSNHQIKTIADLRAKGANVAVVSSTEEVIELLNSFQRFLLH